jgi:DNA-binding response OmpR family regulator
MNANIASPDAALTHGVPRATRYEGAGETPVSAAQNQTRPAENGRPASKRILLADDDPGVREMLGRVLESEHYGVTYAKNGREASAKFIADPPDLVLLDLNMPDRDGWTAFRMMNVAQPMLPVIVITARPNQYPQAADLGVDGLMEKPLNLPILLQAIQDLLSETDAERMRRLTDPEFKTVFLNQRTKATRTGTR